MRLSNEVGTVSSVLSGSNLGQHCKKHSILSPENPRTNFGTKKINNQHTLLEYCVTNSKHVSYSRLDFFDHSIFAFLPDIIQDLGIDGFLGF